MNTNTQSGWKRFRSRYWPATQSDLAKVERNIMATQAEVTAQLTATQAQVAKIGVETRTLLEKITELQAAIDNQNNVSPELQAAADALAAQVKVVDDLVPDSPPAP
jgi:septal ring factor EnvC (AmiA/AmiB activator)